MKKAVYSLQEIAFILQHKSLELLKHYLDKPTMEDCENFSNDIFKATSAIATIENKIEKDMQLTQCTQNVMQRYKQNPIGMFMGAHLSNCTNNINMPK